MTTSRTYDGFNRLTGISSTPLWVAVSPIGARNSSSALESAPTVENPFQSPNVLPAACPSRADVAVRAPITDAGGSHNVVAYISAATGAIVVEYEYGPFGELLRATGPLAKEFNFLFSTKYYDWETGLYYYGYRYYNPSTGRWLSRDPVGEAGGHHLYCIARNGPINRCDRLGLLELESIGTPAMTGQGVYAFAGVWFLLDKHDYNALNSGVGTLVWSKRIIYADTPCDRAIANGFWGDHTMWFKKPFTIMRLDITIPKILLLDRFGRRIMVPTKALEWMSFKSMKEGWF